MPDPSIRPELVLASLSTKELSAAFSIDEELITILFRA